MHSESIDDALVSEINNFLRRHQPPKLPANAMLSAEDFRKLGMTPRELFQTVSENDISNAEAELGFQLPSLLKRIYMQVSNGIAGFSYDIIGLAGGCSSDTGTLVDAYNLFKTGGESGATAWKFGLLPFCNWGCAIYSCVDCTDSTNPVFTYENFGVWAEEYQLAGFFEMWLNGKVSFSEENVEYVNREIPNAFPGKKTTMRVRKRNPPNQS